MITGNNFGENIFDATNIGENYPGVTLPLTFSFVRSAYTHVYTGFLRLLLTSNKKIIENSYAVSNLVAYVDGRIFYNLTNWYRLLKSLPFYQSNKKFFNRMLSPVKSLDTIDAEPSRVSFLSGFMYIFYILFPWFRTAVFERDFKNLFVEFDPLVWKKYPTVQLINKFEQLRDSFFGLWANTIVNDFHVMVFWGLLVSVAKKTFNKPELFLNSVVSARMFPASLKPLEELKKITLSVRDSPGLVRLFDLPAPEIWKLVMTDSQYRSLKTDLLTYLDRYGDRSGQELKLEVPKFSEKPEQVISLLQGYLQTRDHNTGDKKQFPQPMFVKQPILLPLVSLLKYIAVRGIYRREKYRLMRGRAYGIARAVFLELGDRLKVGHHIASSDDVFYLEYSELASLVLFQSIPINPRDLISRRKKLIDSYKHKKVTTRTLAYNWNLDSSQLVHDEGILPKKLTGTGTSITPPVTGRVVVMEEFSVSIPVNGAILVTKKTDPGWTVLFPMIKGIITETGSTLSHASIIARELGVPCITGVKNCTTILKTGDIVTVIPGTGEVVVKNI